MINFSNRLTKLKDRRQGTAERNRLEKGFTAIGADIRTSESYESLKENDAIRYVVGSMAPVSLNLLVFLLRKVNASLIL